MLLSLKSSVNLKCTRIHDTKLAWAVAKSNYFAAHNRIFRGFQCAVCGKVEKDIWGVAYELNDQSHDAMFAHINCMKEKNWDSLIKDKGRVWE